MAYSQKVLDHYENPQNVGTLDIRKRPLEPVWWALLNAAT